MRDQKKIILNEFIIVKKKKNYRRKLQNLGLLTRKVRTFRSTKEISKLRSGNGEHL